MKTLFDRINFPPLQKIIIWLGCFAVAVPLVGYMITGSYMRYSGDDFCYGGILTQFGFWKAQWESYWQVMPYHGNRYSLTLVSHLSTVIGPASSAALPTLALILLTGGIYLNLAQLKKLIGATWRVWEMLIAALMVVFFSFYQAPNLGQSLYWRSGMLPYAAPVIINAFVIGLILKQMNKRQVSKFTIAMLVLLSFLGAGFSETATALQIGFLLLMMGGFWLVSRKGDARFSTGLRLGIYALIISLVALILLAVSPSIVERLDGNHPGVLNFLWITMRSMLSFTAQSFLNQPIPTTINFLLFVVLSMIIPTPVLLSRHTVKEYFLVCVAVTVSCLFLITCIVAPSAYAQSAYPELRALFTARFITVIGVSLTGWVTGYFTAHHLSANNKYTGLIHWSAILVTGVLLIYPLYAARNIYPEIHRYQRWADFWDKRDLQIRQAIQEGQTDLEVMEIDHIIPFVGDLYPNPKHWHNVCASYYYGVNSIAANQPGWDE